MGTDLSAHPGRLDRGRYRRKVQRCLDTLARMLTDGSFSFPRKNIGLEVELNLVDGQLRPSMTNSVVLEALDDDAFTTELGQHNLELNVPPRPLAGDSALHLEEDLHAYLAKAQESAAHTGSSVAMIGILPTLRAEHFDQKWLSHKTRYSSLNDEIFAARGERIALAMDGPALPGHQPERLRHYAESILPEAACTSVQLHLQVAPEEFAAHWNAAQCLAGVQIALASNSPFLLGKALWHETRIPLFQQATDTRPEELKNQGVRPRVWFGERWITSIFDLFEENVRYFPGLLPETDLEDPIEALESGQAPKLSELRLHNGTIWRWNRPVYDVVDGLPHLRVENRVLPAGPTVADIVAQRGVFLRRPARAGGAGSAGLVADVVPGSGRKSVRRRAQGFRSTAVLAGHRLDPAGRAGVAGAAAAGSRRPPPVGCFRRSPGALPRHHRTPMPCPPQRSDLAARLCAARARTRSRP
ncbi:hypothetical protein GCM10027360_86570 [Amycolatopsis echigonensis]